MKHLVLYSLLLAGLAGCKSEGAPTPTPPNPPPTVTPPPVTPPPPSTVTIALHITAKCPGIAPGYAVIAEVGRYSGGTYKSNLASFQIKKDTVDETHTILVNPGSEYAADSLLASIGLPTFYAGFNTLAPGSFAQVDIVVNGQVRKSARLTSNSPSGRGVPYAFADVYWRFKDLQ